MKYIVLLCCSVLLWSCSETEEKKPKQTKEETPKSDQPVNPDDLVEITGNTYREYYDAAKTKLKFEGTQDAEKKRHGKWTHYHQNGNVASMTFYTHGIRNGYSQVNRPNGNMFYHGEYKDDKPTGIWKYYNEKGEVQTEHNYDAQ